MKLFKTLSVMAIAAIAILGIEQLQAKIPGVVENTSEKFLVAQLNERQIAAKAERVTVVINGQNPGSGVIIGKQGDIYSVLTAKHVVATEDEYEIVTPDGVSHRLIYSTVRKLPNVDLAVGKFTSDRDYAIAELGDANKSGTGATIYISGWPHPGQAITQRIFQLTDGKISGRSLGAAEQGYELVYTNITRSGMSGGPVFNRNGQLIAIHGRAEGETIYNPDSGNVVAVKSGFNLGIPINTFINLSPGNQLPANPSLPPLLWDWGTDLQAENKLAEALTYYEKLLALVPDNVPATINIGLVKYEMGQVDAAVSQWQRAIELDAEDSEPKLALAIALYHRGDRDRAFTLASTALASSINLADSKELEEYLWGDTLIDDAADLLAYFKPTKSIKLDWPTTNIRKVAMSLSANKLAYSLVGSDRIELWELNSGQQLRTFPGHSNYTATLDFSPNGKILASGSADNTIKLWNVKSGSEIITLTGHSNPVKVVRFSPNGKILASGSEDSTLKLWDVESGQELRTLAGHPDDVISLSFSPDGKKLASRDSTGLVKLWDVNGGSEIRSFPQFDVDDFFSGSFMVALSPNGKTIAGNVGNSRHNEEKIKLVNSESGAELDTLEVKKMYRDCLRFSSDSRMLVTANNSYVNLWDIGTGQLKHFFVNSSTGCHAIAFTDNNQTLINIDDDKINTWQIP